MLGYGGDSNAGGIPRRGGSGSIPTVGGGLNDSSYARKSLPKKPGRFESSALDGIASVCAT